MAVGIAAVVAGSGIMGDANVKVKDPTTFVAASSVSADGTSLVGVIYNDDLSATVTAETYPGDSYDLTLQLKNETTVDQAHRLVIDAPDGFRFSTGDSQGTGITLTQESPRVFAIEITTAANGIGDTGETIISVESLPQLVPGWYTFSIVSEPLPTDLDNVG
jgi:uncharacterized membrane protein